MLPRLGPRGFSAPGEFSAKFVAPTTDRFIRDHDTTLEQQLLDVAQAQAKPEIPPNRAADDDGREAVSVITRFRFLHQFILPPPPHQPDTALKSSEHRGAFPKFFFPLMPVSILRVSYPHLERLSGWPLRT